MCFEAVGRDRGIKQKRELDRHILEYMRGGRVLWGRGEIIRNKEKPHLKSNTTNLHRKWGEKGVVKKED